MADAAILSPVGNANQFNEGAALKLLRSLIQQSTHKPPSGFPLPVTDTNLECTVHATVASLAFAVCRMKTRVASGLAFLFTPEKHTPFLPNHSFVVRETDGAVFDSSLTIPMASEETKLRINGI